MITHTLSVLTLFNFFFSWWQKLITNSLQFLRSGPFSFWKVKKKKKPTSQTLNSVLHDCSKTPWQCLRGHRWMCLQTSQQLKILVCSSLCSHFSYAELPLETGCSLLSNMGDILFAQGNRRDQDWKAFLSNVVPSFSARASLCLVSNFKSLLHCLWLLKWECHLILGFSGQYVHRLVLFSSFLCY